MTLVLDSSVALAWCFADEVTPAIEAIMSAVADDSAAVPSLWRFEVGNGLQMAVRRRRIDEAYRDRALAMLGAFDINADEACDAHVWSASVRLAARHDLTVYDAAYLELAQRRRLKLATLDGALARAARTDGVDVMP